MQRASPPLVGRTPLGPLNVLEPQRLAHLPELLLLRTDASSASRMIEEEEEEDTSNKQRYLEEIFELDLRAVLELLLNVLLVGYVQVDGVDPLQQQRLL